MAAMEAVVCGMDRLTIIVPGSNGEDVFPRSSGKWLLDMQRDKMALTAGSTYTLLRLSPRPNYRVHLNLGNNAALFKNKTIGSYFVVF